MFTVLQYLRDPVCVSENGMPVGAIIPQKCRNREDWVGACVGLAGASLVDFARHSIRIVAIVSAFSEFSSIVTAVEKWAILETIDFER